MNATGAATATAAATVTLAVAAPAMTAPTVTAPTVTAPPVGAPPVTALPVTVPPVTAPPVTAPSGTTPSVTAPTVTASPAAALPDATAGERKIVAFLCRECAYSAADAAGNARTPLPPTIRTIMVPCTGRVSPLHILGALAAGADGVYVAGCLEGQCHYRVGNLHAIDRIAFVRELLGSVGVEPERVAMFTMSAADTPRFVATARAMHETIARLPRLPRT
jgi:coenzyme F420-reducing hydrogenase delta subunit